MRRRRALAQPSHSGRARQRPAADVCDGAAGLRPGDRRTMRWRSASRARRTQGVCVVGLRIAPPRPDRPLGRAVRRGRPGLDPFRQRPVAADRRAVRRPRCAHRHQPVLRRHPARRAARRSCSTSPPARSPQGKTRVAFNKGVALEPGTIIDDRRRADDEPALHRGRADRRAAAVRRAQGLGPGADLRAARRRARRRRGRRPGDRRPAPRSSTACSRSSSTPDRLGTEDSYFAEVARFTAWAQSDANGGVLLPGDIEAETRARRIAEGIPIDARSWADITAAAAEVGVPPPEGAFR